MAEDFAAPKTRRELLALIESDKGNKIATLEARLEELETTLPGRLELREQLELYIGRQKEKQIELERAIAKLEENTWKSEDNLEILTRKLEETKRAQTSAENSIKDLEAKKTERNEVARELLGLRAEEKELLGSISLKTLELRSLEVQMNPIRERESAVTLREEKAKELEAKATEDLKEAIRKNTETTKLQAQAEEDRRYVDLSGKTMGYYIRGVQKKFDELGVKIDFIKLLDEIK